MFSLLLAIIYLAFISLGLPDCMLGAAWPTMYPEFGVPVSYAGIVSFIIASGTVISSLMSDRLTLKLGTGRVTAISVAITAAALLGFSFSHNFYLICLLGIPYGLGAGSVDAALNNYVAIHYSSKHMSWLHCMWGIGAASGPYVMGFALNAGHGWNAGYRYVGIFQILLTVILFLSLPIWKGRSDLASSASEDSGEKASVTEENNSSARKPLSIREVLSIKGAKEIMFAFFAYSGIEQTAMLWGASYFVIKEGLSAEKAAGFGGMFAIGITLGRLISGFMTMKWNDEQMIRIGQATIILGLIMLFLPLGYGGAVIGFALVGLGCAPIYPSIIHSTPAHFGEDKSQAVVGMEMAFAYTGAVLLPPLFGLIAQHISIGLLPVYLTIWLVVNLVMHELLIKK